MLANMCRSWEKKHLSSRWFVFYMDGHISCVSRQSRLTLSPGMTCVLERAVKLCGDPLMMMQLSSGAPMETKCDSPAV